jgi:hypothetical protein
MMDPDVRAIQLIQAPPLEGEVVVAAPPSDATYNDQYIHSSQHSYSSNNQRPVTVSKGSVGGYPQTSNSSSGRKTSDDGVPQWQQPPTQQDAAAAEAQNLRRPQPSTWAGNASGGPQASAFAINQQQQQQLSASRCADGSNNTLEQPLAAAVSRPGGPGPGGPQTPIEAPPVDYQLRSAAHQPLSASGPASMLGSVMPLKDAMLEMRRGTMLLKYCRSGVPHLRFFTVQNKVTVYHGERVELPHLCWSSSVNGTVSGQEPLPSLRQVVLGPAGPNASRFIRSSDGVDVLDNNKRRVDPGMCVALLFEERSLELCVLTKSDYPVWVGGFIGIEEKNKQIMMQQEQQELQKQQ